MRFALVDKERQEAQPRLQGECLGCGSSMVAKCGETKVWHWAHWKRSFCDSWWENETEWHRNWKNQFPMDWQEIPHRSKYGEKHIADVKTDHGMVFEFQHSFLNPQERRVRDSFYQKLIWIVDGTRRPTDRKQLEKALQEGRLISQKPQIWRIIFTEECRLLKEWSGCRGLVFFDFGGDLWMLFPKNNESSLYFFPLSRSDLVKIHCNGNTEDFDRFIGEFPERISNYELQIRSRAMKQDIPRPYYDRSRRPQSFQQYLARQRIARSRKRF